MYVKSRDNLYSSLPEGMSDSGGICNVNRRSDLTRVLTLSTLSSVFEVEGLPARGSYSTCSRPSKKDLCHLNTCALDRECSP